MASQILTFPCVADTYTAVNYPSSNFGSSSTLRVGRTHLQNILSTYASFFGFDLSTIPKNKVITGAYLSVFNISFTDRDGNAPASQWYDLTYRLETDPIVLRARRIKDIPNSTIESTLCFNDIKALKSESNMYDMPFSTNDTSVNVSLTRGTVVNFPLYDLSKSDNGQFIIALFRDDNFMEWLPWQYAVNIYSKEGYTKPQLTVTINDYVLAKPSNLSPNNSTRNKSGDIKLSWQWEDTYMGTSQAGYEVSYSTDGFVTSIAKTGTTNSYTAIVANTFTLGQTVQYKVRITDTNGDTSAWSDIASFTIGATVPSTPEAIGPMNTIVNSSDDIFFRWKFIDLYGYQQAKFDLQYRKGIATETTIAVTSAVNQHMLPRNTIIAGGDYSWRVRCYNAFNEVSAYTPWQPFYAIGQPEAPTISSVSNNARPTVIWTANDQDIFVLKIYKDNIVVFDSKEHISENSFIIPEYLDNGSYRVGIKTRNVYGFWSNETSYPFTISTVKPPKPSMSLSINNLYIALIVNSETVQNVIYRKSSKDDKYIQLAIITGNTFIDYSANAGDNLYFVRAVTVDSFTDSDSFTVNLLFDGIVLSGSKAQSEMINLYQTKDVDKRKMISPSKAQFIINCNGRTYPIQQSMTFKNHSENHEYFIKVEQFDKCYSIFNNNDTLLYRNGYGYSFIASISNMTMQEDVLGYIVAFTITRLEE